MEWRAEWPGWRRTVGFMVGSILHDALEAVRIFAGDATNRVVVIGS